MYQYVIILSGTNFPYYLVWKSESVDSLDWTHDLDQAFKYDSYGKAYDDLTMLGINGYVKEIKTK